MEQREFLDIIRTYRRRLNLAGFLKWLVFALGVGAGVGILFQAVSLLTPLYYANVYTVIAIFLAVAAAMAVSFIRRSTMEHAALTMDAFGFQERIITAYEHQQEDGTLFTLQRRDAMEQLKNHRDRIRIPLWPHWKRTALSVALLAVMVGLALAPSQVKDRAKELHQIHKEAREKEEEIEEVLEELEKLEQEALTPEQLAALQEMMESLQSSRSEYSQASSAEALQAASDKLSYKYENMSSQMSDLAQSLQDGATISPMSAETMQAMAEKLQEMSGNPSSGGDKFASGQDQGGQGDGQSGQGNQGDGQDGQGNGQGSQGDGQGSGQGDGQGDGQGSGQGEGTGSGRGTGTVNNPHDYVSIPNAVADSGNLTGNAGNHNDSDYFRAQNGLSWEGTHMPHEAVIGSYERNAYEGIAAGRYPSGMESVIKEYFASFN